MNKRKIEFKKKTRFFSHGMILKNWDSSYLFLEVTPDHLTKMYLLTPLFSYLLMLYRFVFRELRV